MAHTNTYSYAVSLGFPLIRGEGRGTLNPDVWLSRFENARGDAIFVGYDGASKRFLVDTCGLFGVGIETGSRVELSPACDLWMQGARFGTVRKIEGGIAHVRMDHRQVRELQRIPVDLLRRLRPTF